MLEEIKDIRASLWISASAGTGKTKSLIDRILALLFNRINPSKILCLTYTNSAASEMLSRLSKYFHDLNSKTENELSQLGFSNLSPQFISSLYEQSLEPSNWVQIKTIHSFCFDILKKFPIETGLFPGVKICDDFQRQQLIKEAIKQALENAELQRYFECIAQFTTNIEEIFQKHSAKIVKFLSQFDDFETLYGDFFNIETDDLFSYNLTNILMEKIIPDYNVVFRELSQILYMGSKEDIEKAKILDSESFINAFLTNDGKIRSRLCSKKLSESHPGFLEKMQLLAEEVYKFLEQKKKYISARSNIAFFYVMRVVAKNYSELKRANNLVDFDDVIAMTSTLLQNIEWVMYKIDGGIDHVLVDEAQDTNSDQWEIIRLITDEFFSNYKSERTVFVVGDEKQSIYSFQGVDINLFHKMHDYFKIRSEKNGQKFYDVSLNKSYRTTGNILSFIDQVFKESFPGIMHATNRNQNSGFVEIVQPFENDQEKEETPWEEYKLNRNFQPSEKKLSLYIANLIYHIIDSQVFVESKNRAALASDFLILFQRRKFMKNVVTELKALNIPVVDIDRVVLQDELIVEDLISFAEFSMLPFDELSFAIVLKSPIIGISENELMNLCLKRKDENLWNYVCENNSEIVEKLAEIISHVNEMSAYDYFIYALNNGIREKFLKRYGRTALDVISEFLDIVLKYESENNPTLHGFVKWFKSFEHEIKRESFTDKNCVKLMTVHSSKGLQAPFVIIADSHFFGKKSERILRTDDGVLIWNFSKDFLTAETLKILESVECSQIEESKRLLYVAMTRAEDFLYILGETSKSQNEYCWMNFITHEKLQEIEFKGRKNFRVGNYATISSVINNEQIKIVPQIPDYFFEKFPKISPENVSREIKNEQTLFGDCVHLLLQKMPKYVQQEYDLFDQIADTFTSKFCLSNELKNAAKQEAYKIIFDSDFKFLFDEKSLSEISVMFNGAEKRIDKIAIKDNYIWIVDFKTGTPQNRIPHTYMSQLFEYKKAISEIMNLEYIKFNNISKIKTAILWTKNASLIEIQT